MPASARLPFEVCERSLVSPEKNENCALALTSHPAPDPVDRKSALQQEWLWISLMLLHHQGG